jgi:predicted DCC family thiol-disulfide oxidoreductase YuxK
MNTEDIRQHKIVLFDGVCNLCNNSVIFILQHECGPVFKFASIQSEPGKGLLQWCGLPDDYSEAVVLIDKGRKYLGSSGLFAK